MSIYQKIRPTTFDGVIGNTAAVAALRKASSSATRQHTFLFTGPSGCGKTTLAKVLAKAIGCEDMNVLEINAASSRGIDMTRKLQEDARYSSLGSGNRCVILDECHSLTRQAQDSLLKTLEDVPEFLTYCLCSTDPQKILKTIKTRCDIVEVKLLTDDEMESLLDQSIKKAEIPDPSEEIFFAIVDAAKGCPRTALVLLEKQNGMDGSQALDVIQSYEGETKEVIDLCRAVVSGKWSQVRTVYKAMVETDSEKIRYAILGYLHTCLLGSKGGDAERFAGMLEVFSQSTMYNKMGGLLGMIYKATVKGKRR